MKKNIQKQLFEAYNKPDTLLVLSSYPKKGETYSKGVSAEASFTKNTLLKLKREFNYKKIVVFAIIIDKEEIYEEDGILVVRCFKRDNPLSFLRTLLLVGRFNKASSLIAEFEFATFGDTLTTAFFPVFILFARLMGKNIITVAHQVLTDIASLAQYIGMHPKNYKLKLFSFLIKIYFVLLGIFSNSIIVREQHLKERLSGLVKSDKVSVIPLGIEDYRDENINKNTARKKLSINKNDLVLLYFGYITWYKGVDFLIEALSDIKTLNGKKVKLIIAGGTSFTQGKKEHYKRFFDKTMALTKNRGNITITGFVEEENIATYFAASDLVILPYRIFMASSGPLATAIGMRKPFLISKKLEKLTESYDFKNALAKLDLDKSDIIFELNSKSLIRKISNSLNVANYERLEILSSNLAENRNFVKIASLYSSVIKRGVTKNVHKKMLFPLPAFIKS